MKFAIMTAVCLFGAIAASGSPPSSGEITIEDLRRENVRLAEHVSSLKKRLRETRAELKELRRENASLRNGIDPKVIDGQKLRVEAEWFDFFHWMDRTLASNDSDDARAALVQVMNTSLSAYMRMYPRKVTTFEKTATWFDQRARQLGVSDHVENDASAIRRRLNGLSRADSAKAIGAMIGLDVEWSGVVIEHDDYGYLAVDCNGVRVDCGTYKMSRFRVGSEVNVSGKIAKIDDYGVLGTTVTLASARVSG